jgi:heptosyltransferase-2
MSERTQDYIERLLVIMPTWVGDIVMATPLLNALRQRYADAQVDCLVRSYAGPLLDACPWYDKLLCYGGASKDDQELPGGMWRLSMALRQRGGYDLAVILPNSFRTALVARLAGAKRRIGYQRDGRGWLLTDRLQPARAGRRFVPTPTLDYYLDIARRLGAADPDPAMQLFTRPDDDRIVDQRLTGAGVDDQAQPVVILNPGAKFGQAKLWYADRFAAVADRLIDEYNATVLVNGAPAERPILDQVHQAAAHDLIDLPTLGNDLKLLKSYVKRADLMITNDTGPRHIAAAFGVPVVSIFGPTDPRWTTIDFPLERQIQVDVDCGPCQKKLCPLDHRCMTRISVDMVYQQAVALLAEAPDHRLPVVDEGGP